MTRRIFVADRERRNSEKAQRANILRLDGEARGRLVAAMCREAARVVRGVR